MKRIQAEGSALGAFGATMLALALLVWWTRDMRAGWLALALVAETAAILLLVRAWLRGPGVPRGLGTALALLLAAMGAATLFSWQLDRADRAWSAVVEEREAGLGAALEARMADVVQRGRSASERAAALALRLAPDSAARPRTGRQRDVLFRQLGVVHDQLGVEALAVYRDDGNLIAWAGEHRGVLPDSIWLRPAGAWFEERPLFTYLYFTVPVPGLAERAIAAVLIETGTLSDGALADADGNPRIHARASFHRGGAPDAVWALVEAGDTVVHARLDPLTQGEWRLTMERVARRVILLAALLAWVALAFGWMRWRGRGRGARAAVGASVPLLLLVPLAAAAPLRDALGAERLFSPTLFTLPLPGDATLGRLLALLLVLAAFVAAARRRPRPLRRVLLRAGLGTVLVAAAYPLVLRLLLDGATPLLYGSPAYWIAFQLAAVLLLATLTALLLPRARVHGEEKEHAPGVAPRRRRWLLAGALLASTALALAVSMRGRPDEPVQLAGAALWAVPFALAALGLAPLGGRSGSILRWLMAGWIAGTAVLPHLWVADVDARLRAAEAELATLGTRADPFLHYLLESFAEEARTRFDAGERDVQLLYRTWIASGLARQPYTVNIVLWTEGGFPDAQLGSEVPVVPGDVDRLLAIVDSARGRTGWRVTPFTDLPTMAQLLTVPLPDGSLITVRVPPRRTLDRTSPIAPFLGVISPFSARLNLVEVSGPEPQRESTEWTAHPSGWRSEAVVKYPEGWYHAHLTVALPPPGVRFARASLLLALDLAILALLWLSGVLARGTAAVPRRELAGWLGSFRARVTLALLAFFLVPTAVFGWAAYGALSGEVARAAQTVAQHSVARAVVEFQEGAGDLRDLAAHAGTDVLRYQGGELIDVSSREALDLGVYNAWLPPLVFQRLESGEEIEDLETQTLGSHAYVTAYRTLPASGVLGVPMSLSAGDVTQRQREFAHLLLFAVLVGALLSLALSLAAGRALAGPISQLRRAAAAVGAGSLRIRLPERTGDEFGQLFTSFNRMARRLRRARARELRTARVLAWGEMARQVAHEIKNPLTPIKLSVQHLRRAHADRRPNFDEILESNVSQILVEIDRLSEIARAFSRYGAPSPATEPLADVDVAAVVREALMLYRAGDRHVSYVQDVQPDVPRVRARANELKEVLLNLVENSRAALDGGGEITVRAAARDGVVEVEVADDGPGIPPDLLPRIFEPHFSTSSSGTGLGLAIVRRLVESWGGTVTAESEEGRGTVVRLRLKPAPATAPGS